MLPCESVDASVLALDEDGDQLLRRLIASGKPVRLGILGGTFDPVHNGHLYCAKEALEKAQLDMVALMPAGMPVFKLDKPVTPGVHRLAMCQCAVRGFESLAVSAMEVNREGKTFTADTLRAMRAALPKRVQFFFIMGADSAASFLKWREHDVIAQLATLVVFSSADHPMPLDGKAALETAGVRVEYVEADPPDISSTQIREKVRKGQQIGALVPSSVYDYLCEKCLYGTACNGEEGRVDCGMQEQARTR